MQQTITVNGTPQTTGAATIAELVAELKLATDSLVVEHNRTIVRQESWSNTPLNEGDALELLNFVGGG